MPHWSFDWPTLIANKDKEIGRLEAAYIRDAGKAGVEIIRTRAVVADANTVELADGKRVRAAYILVATGGAPSYGDPIPGIEHAITSNEAFHLPHLPKHVVIQGGGYIAVEFAGMFAGFGSHVTLVYRGEKILRGFDDEVRSPCAQGHGKARHQGHHRRARSQPSKNTGPSVRAFFKRLPADRRLRDVRDRPQSEHREDRAGGGGC